MDNLPQDITDEKLKIIVRNFCKEGVEREQVEFKIGNSKPETIAKYISGITNTMTLRNYPRGYVVWGIKDDTHEIVGTNFRPFHQKIGNEDLVLWLSKHIKPAPAITFRELMIDGLHIVVLIISSRPLGISKADGTAYIRIGANLRPLEEFEQLQKDLWTKILSCDAESATAMPCLTKEEVMELLDFEAFYNMRKNRVPVERDLLFKEATRVGILRNNRDGTYDILNMGALLYAKDLQDFPQLATKSIRVIRYRDTSKLLTLSEERSRGGYIVEYRRIFQYILSQVIAREPISEDGIRRPEYLYPELAIRELFVNIFTHQDLTLSTMHPTVEIFSDRIEFSNAGAPLVPEDRFVDHPPQTRNCKIAEELVKTGICDSQGSGWDKVALASSEFGYPAPRPDVTETTTRVTLVQKRTLDDMTNEERMWSIYIYACLLWTKKEFLTNTCVRKLFNIPDDNVSMASNLLSQAREAGHIVIFDEQSGNRNRKYIPFYAKNEI